MSAISPETAAALRTVALDPAAWGWVRSGCLEVLSVARDDRHVECVRSAVADLLTDPDPEMRSAAIAAAAELRRSDLGALSSTIAALAERDPSQPVREAAQAYVALHGPCVAEDAA